VSELYQPTAKQIEKRALRILQYFDAGFYEDFLYASKAKRLAGQAVSLAYDGNLKEAEIVMIQAENLWKKAGGKAR
jgi:hypothetical protein